MIWWAMAKYEIYQMCEFQKIKWIYKSGHYNFKNIIHTGIKVLHKYQSGNKKRQEIDIF